MWCVSVTRQLFAAVSVALLCQGCAVGLLSSELSNRGGLVDQKLDERWILADTKQMRVLRAYVVIGSLARMSRENYYKSERQLIAQHVNTAVRVAFDAYACAYSRPGDCVYFDERMAELEVAVIRLAVAVFSKHENESLFQLVAQQAGDDLPLLKLLSTAGKAVDTAAAAADTVASTGKLLKSLLQFSEAAYFTGRRAGALYRDSIELTMVATLGSLDVQCKGADRLADNFPSGERSSVVRTFQQFYGHTDGDPEACTQFQKGLTAWNQGSGDLSEWHAYLSGDVTKFRQSIIPGEGAFVQASDLIWRACDQIAETDAQLAVCLGHRGPEATALECNINQSGVLRVDANKLVDKTAWQEFELEENSWGRLVDWMASHDSCRLILFAKTWYVRNGRLRGASDARLYWLSLGGSEHISYRAAAPAETAY